jgi:hypothetical protein
MVYGTFEECVEKEIRPLTGNDDDLTTRLARVVVWQGWHITANSDEDLYPEVFPGGTAVEAFEAWNTDTGLIPPITWEEFTADYEIAWGWGVAVSHAHMLAMISCAR